MPYPKKKAKPCKDHFLLMSDKAKRNFMVCDKCGYKLLGSDILRPVKLENRWFFEH
jgi:hypothetical protein